MTIHVLNWARGKIPALWPGLLWRLEITKTPEITFQFCVSASLSRPSSPFFPLPISVHKGSKHFHLSVPTGPPLAPAQSRTSGFLVAVNMRLSLGMFYLWSECLCVKGPAYLSGSSVVSCVHVVGSVLLSKDLDAACRLAVRPSYSLLAVCWKLSGPPDNLRLRDREIRSLP